MRNKKGTIQIVLFLLIIIILMIGYYMYYTIQRDRQLEELINEKIEKIKEEQKITTEEAVKQLIENMNCNIDEVGKIICK